jgi:hypothetical protein
MRMRWVDLLFMHWPMPPEAMAPLVPAGLELDLYDGQAWLGIVPFQMQDVAPRGLPPIPRLSVFPELNVRTYVRHGKLGGVLFLSLDAASRLTVWGARRFFDLPYYNALMSVERDGDTIEYRSTRTDARGRPAILAIDYGPTGPVESATPGSFEAWLTDRQRLFAPDERGRIRRTEIRHPAWPLQPAHAEVREVSMAAAHGLTLPNAPPHLRYSARLDVRAWAPRPA